ncbi:MAG TPA: metalloregulator ArsR/SmtB family transcription factor [Alphaproteobacteria bacterium]|nr:metalloregulator ArsR/SmtB family transcription factor [Alphaproteobacteria bacterium]
MNRTETLTALAALAHGARWEIVRLLARRGLQGMTAGDLGEAVGIPATALSFHLAQLAQAGLVAPRRIGRQIWYAADSERLDGLLAQLAEAFHPDPAAAAASGRRALDGEAMSSRIYNVLFLCTGNSARSIMAEALLTRWGEGRFRAYSAGSHPKGSVHPLTLELLRSFNFKVDGFRSKNWDEFAAPGAPALDFVFTVCDDAAGEVCPVWPGQPLSAHWGVEDPAAFVGPRDKHLRLFRRVYTELDNRIKIFTSLRLDALDRMTLQRRVAEIGRARLEAPADAAETA